MHYKSYVDNVGPNENRPIKSSTNLTMSQSLARVQVDRLRRDEYFEVGDDLVLLACRLYTLSHLISTCVWVGLHPRLAGPPCVPCIKLQKAPLVQ